MRGHVASFPTASHYKEHCTKHLCTHLCASVYFASWDRGFVGKRGWGEAQRYIGPDFLGFGVLNTALRLPLNSSHQESWKWEQALFWSSLTAMGPRGGMWGWGCVPLFTGHWIFCCVTNEAGVGLRAWRQQLLLIAGCLPGPGCGWVQGYCIPWFHSLQPEWALWVAHRAPFWKAQACFKLCHHPSMERTLAD